MVKVMLLVLATILALTSPAWGKRPHGHGPRATAFPALVMPPPPPAPIAPPPRQEEPKPATFEAVMVSNMPPAATTAAGGSAPLPEIPAPHVPVIPPPAVERAPDPPVLHLEEPTLEPSSDAVIHRWMLGIKAGGVLLPPGGGASDSLALTLEGGYVLPVLDNHLQLYGSAGYANPHRTLTVQGGNQIAGGASAALTTQQLWITAGVLARILPLENRFNAYAFGGACVIGQFMQSNTRSGGSTIGTASDSSVGVGGQGGLGIEIGLGPGKITLEGSVTWVPTNSALSGPMTAGGVAAQAGYRWMF